jgi:hypothetical protein
LSEFIAADVEFLLVGAYALAAHGLPRATGDIDIWVRRSHANSQRIMLALARFGAPLADVTASDFEEENMILQIGLPPRRIDVLTRIDGVEFSEAWESRVVSDLGELRVPVIGREHLIQNKEATGRPKDRQDVGWLTDKRLPQSPRGREQSDEAS